MRIAFALSALFAIAGCSEGALSSSSKPASIPEDLPSFFDCLDQSGKAVVAAHRGGPARGYPENALESMDRMVSNGVWLLEIDIRTSRDGVLFLHHDEDLDRSTSGEGRIGDQNWVDLRELSLFDNAGEPTPYRLARFDDVLAWANGKAVLELDFKSGTDYDDVALAVRSADAEKRVIPIAYNINQALALNRRFPNSTISVPVDSDADIKALNRGGLDTDRILAWGGIETVNVDLFETLGDETIEVAFGTLGGRNSHDEQIRRSGDDSRYTDYIAADIDVIATDRPIAAKKALMSAGLWGDRSTCPAQ
ncbi:MAG: glycerophosphodiester phosphodiesterase family protein [Parvularcula sp.]